MMHTFRKKRESRTFFTVKEEVNLYDFIFSKMGGMSKTSVKNLLTKGQVKVNEKIATQYNLPLKPNDKIEMKNDELYITFEAIDQLGYIHSVDMYNVEYKLQETSIQDQNRNVLIRLNY